MDIRRFIAGQDSFDELIELFRTGLGDTDRRFWEWKYFANSGFDKQIIYIVADNNKMIAMMGFIPLEYICADGTIHRFVQMCDLVVHPDCRGQGLFYKIYHYAEDNLTAEGYEAFVSFPNHNSLHGFKKMNYTVINMKSYSLGINLKQMLLHKIGLGKKFKNESRYDVEILSENIGKTADEYDKNTAWLTDGSLRLNVNNHYLSWRCEQYNAGKYKCITIKDNGTLAAYFVVLVTKGRRATAGKIVSFDIGDEYIKDIKSIAGSVKQAVYSFVDMIDFYGMWNTHIESVITEAFGISLDKRKNGGEFIIKMLGSRSMIKDDLFINHIDTDL